MTVATLGSSQRFPAFYTPDSGLDVSYFLFRRLRHILLIRIAGAFIRARVASMILWGCANHRYSHVSLHLLLTESHLAAASHRLGLQSGMVFAVPIPEESAENALVIPERYRKGNSRSKVRLTYFVCSTLFFLNSST